jgi:hypothetical protein
MRDDEILGYTRPKSDDKDAEGNGCFGVIMGCVITFIIIAIVVTVVWLWL